MADKAEDEPVDQLGNSDGALHGSKTAGEHASPTESHEKVAEKQPETKAEEKKPSKLNELCQKT